MPKLEIFTRIRDGFRAGAAIDRARKSAKPGTPGERHLGFVAVIGDSYHAETADGRSLGSFSTNDAAADALARAAGPHG